MNYANALGAEFREVRETTRNGEPARVVQGTRIYATDADDLWDALTNATRIPRWFLPIDGDLRLGGRFQLEGNAAGEILRCDPPEALDVTWEYGEHPSWVTVRLEPDGNGTRLTLKHIMLKDEEAEAHWKKFGPGATGVGWDLSFFGLALHLDSGGDTIDQEANEAWMASESGKEFIRGCAEAWGEAHIASGEVPEIARSMARQTAGFYTGA